MYTDETIKQAVRDHISLKRGGKRGGLKLYARDIDINPAELSAVMHGYRRPSEKILEDMGLKKVFMYVPKEAP